MISMNAEDAKLIARVPPALRAPNGIPEIGQAAARERAAALASDALADLLLPDGIRTSPLGPGWSRDIDLHLSRWPKPATLKDLGWMSLDDLLHRLGIRDRGIWAIVDEGRILAELDLHVGPPPDPVASLISRCQRRGEVRVREVLEARVLLRAGHELPADSPVIRVAARVEAGLGGQALAQWGDGPALEGPARLPAYRISRRWANTRSILRPRLVVAVSGVDGSGKSTLSRLVARNLGQADIPVSHVWARPGGIRARLLNGLVRILKRLLRQDPSWGSTRVAKGASGSELASRRGSFGWIWTMVIVLMYLIKVGWQHVRGRGILLYDRHLLDALVHLDFVYEGVDLRLHRALIARVLPKPALSIYLDVPAEVAMTRKPEETEDIYSGEYSVRRQLENYERRRDEIEGIRRLDGRRPAEELAAVVTRWIAEL